MGEKKAIIFSTHILEEVDAACTRAIIIDRGRIVANGTPAELRAKSEMAGAVTLKISGVAGSAISAKLCQVHGMKKVTILEEKGGRVLARAFPKTAGANGAFARAISEAVQGWCVEELHLEEGRLDEVFRSITMSDTQK